MAVKRTIKKSEALSSTKDMLRGESKETYSVMGNFVIKLSESANRVLFIATDRYLRYPLKKGVKKDANRGISTK